MSGFDRDAIWKRARQDMMLIGPRGEKDPFLWEYVSRVACNAELIAGLPEVATQRPDQSAILAAALYHEAGWVVRCREGETCRTHVLAMPAERDHIDISVSLVQRRLQDVLPPESLDRAVNVLPTLNQRQPPWLEACVVIEARNLEEFGFLPLWSTIRRHIIEGKAVQAVIDNWHRRRDYQYWTARLRDAFRFEPVRNLAKARLQHLERFMADLEQQHRGMDLAALLAPPPAAVTKHLSGADSSRADEQRQWDSPRA